MRVKKCKWFFMSILYHEALLSSLMCFKCSGGVFKIFYVQDHIISTQTVSLVPFRFGWPLFLLLT